MFWGSATTFLVGIRVWQTRAGGTKAFLLPLHHGSLPGPAGKDSCQAGATDDQGFLVQGVRDTEE